MALPCPGTTCKVVLGITCEWWLQAHFVFAFWNYVLKMDCTLRPPIFQPSQDGGSCPASLWPQFWHIFRWIVFGSFPIGPCYCIISSHYDVLCSKFKCESSLKMHLGRWEYALGIALRGNLGSSKCLEPCGYFLFFPKPSLVAFSKNAIQPRWCPLCARSCGRHWEDKEERGSSRGDAQTHRRCS